MQTSKIKAYLLVSLIAQSIPAMAETYKCEKDGKVVYSDIPCSHTARRVDGMSDNVSRDQRRQADQVNYNNRRQLQQLEYESARNQYAPRRATLLK